MNILEFNMTEEPSNDVVCSLRTEAFQTSSGYSISKKIYFLKSLCKGSQGFIEEDISICGIAEFMNRIINLWEVPDGKYVITIRDAVHEYVEGNITQYLEDWNYELSPYEQPN